MIRSRPGCWRAARAPAPARRRRGRWSLRRRPAAPARRPAPGRCRSAAAVRRRTPRGLRSRARAGRPTWSISSAASLSRSAFATATPAQPQRLGHDVLRGQVRVERAVRILEDHLDVETQRAQLARSEQLGEVRAVEVDPPDGRREQPHERLGDGRLAAAGFADDGERLAARDARRRRRRRRGRCPAGVVVVHDEVARRKRNGSSCHGVASVSRSTGAGVAERRRPVLVPGAQLGDRRRAACGCNRCAGSSTICSAPRRTRRTRPSFMTWIAVATSAGRRRGRA